MGQVSHVDAVVVENLLQTFGVYRHYTEVIELFDHISNDFIFQILGSFVYLFVTIFEINWKARKVFERICLQLSFIIADELWSKDILNILDDKFLIDLFGV